MEYTAIITMLIVLQLMIFAMMVGKTRVSTGVKAPATTGDPLFERCFRAHQNSIENAIIVIPALVVFNYYWDARIGAALGLIYVVARFVYMKGYTADAAKRGKGFGLSFLCEVVLVLGALIGAILAVFRG